MGFFLAYNVIVCSCDLNNFDQLPHLKKKKGKSHLHLFTLQNNLHLFVNIMGIPQGLSDKQITCNAGDTGNVGLIPGSGRSPGEGNGNPLQYSCLGNPMDRGA